MHTIGAATASPPLVFAYSPDWGYTGTRPPLFFDSVKETLQRGFSCRCASIHLPRRARCKRKNAGRKTARCALFAYDTGAQQETAGKLSLEALGAGPDLLRLPVMRPRRTAIVRRGMQDRFDLRFPAAAALPISNRPSRCLLVARSEAERAGPEGHAFHRVPPKAAPTPPTAGKHSLCSQRPRRTR